MNQSFDSNVVDVVTAAAPSASSIELTRVVGPGGGLYQETVGPSACLQGGNFNVLADPTLTGGTVIDPTQIHDSNPTTSYNLGEPVFIRLDDADQNIDFLAIDYAVVTVSNSSTGDSETIQLAETGLDTGVFAGFVPTASGAAAAGDCILQGSSASNVSVDYVDPGDPGDVANFSALFDPSGIVFESRTGTPVNGATIEIVDAISGLPATVYGNDGVSTYPSSITSGATATDSSGASYVFGPGEYRFPVVPDGDYRLIVTPPADYSAPSTASETDLQTLPGAPFSLGPGSFGQTFTQTGPVTLTLDIPVDPAATALFLQKSTLTTIAAPGDFVRYEIAIENTSSTGLATDVTIVDRMPEGIRYVPGSSTLDSAATSDPQIDMSARTLTFDIGDLAVGQRLSLFYVVEIIGGSANDQLVNTATAFAGSGLISNESAAIIRLTEDLFRSTTTIIGRVVEADCTNSTFSEDEGVAGIRIYLEDGRYAVSDEGGRFHFEGLTPGTHVAQIDRESVPAYFDVVRCDTATGFAGRADSQFVRTTRGSLTRADFYLRRKQAPEGQIDIEMQNVEADSASQVGYVLNVRGEGNVRISNLDVMLVLPDGVSFAPGTLKIGDEFAVDPRLVGPSVNIRLPDQENDWLQKIEFTANIADNVAGDLATVAMATFDTPIEAGQRTPNVETRMVRETAVVENEGYVLNLNFDVLSADLSTADQLELGILIEDWQGVSDISIQAIGHSDSDRISAANRHLFADNYVLSAARARAAAQFIAEALNVPRENVQVEGRGPDDPVASNATADGRKSNRRVEMILSGSRPTKPSFLQVTKATSGTRFAETKGAIPGTEEEMLATRQREARQLDLETYARQEEPPITELEPGIEMLLPLADHLPPLPVTKVSIKHGVQQTAQVYLNDKPVTSLNFDGIVTNVAETFAISRWAGIDLDNGSNTLRAVITNPDGTIAQTIVRDITYTGAPIRGELVKDMSVLVADGKTRPVVAIRFFDRNGEKTRAGSAGTFSVSAPYRSWWEVEDDRKNAIVEIGNRRPLYRVMDDGIALIELEPTANSGEATLTFNYENNRQQEIRVWLSAEPRDWILVGFAEGTVGYNTISDNATAAFNAGFEDGYYDDGRVAFFAKGAIKGDYLLTLAFDSARDRDESRNQFLTQIDPNAYYSLYADTSEQRFEAASQRKVFVKLEKRQFFALFGDFNTGLSYTELGSL